MSELFEDLKKLGEMRERGEITQSEYEIVKQELLAEMGADQDADKTETRSPGWYNDPEGRYSHQAYWDGEKWTGDTRSSPPIDEHTTQAKDSRKGRSWVAFIGIGMVAVVLFGLGLGGTVSDLGTPSYCDDVIQYTEDYLLDVPSQLSKGMEETRRLSEAPSTLTGEEIARRLQVDVAPYFLGTAAALTTRPPPSELLPAWESVTDALIEASDGVNDMALAFDRGDRTLLNQSEAKLRRAGDLYDQYERQLDEVLDQCSGR